MSWAESSRFVGLFVFRSNGGKCEAQHNTPAQEKNNVFSEMFRSVCSLSSSIMEIEWKWHGKHELLCHLIGNCLMSDCVVDKVTYCNEESSVQMSYRPMNYCHFIWLDVCLARSNESKAISNCFVASRNGYEGRGAGGLLDTLNQNAWLPMRDFALFFMSFWHRMFRAHFFFFFLHFPRSSQIQAQRLNAKRQWRNWSDNVH